MARHRRDSLRYANMFLTLAAATLLSWSCAHMGPRGEKTLDTWWISVPGDDTALPDNNHVSRKRDQRVVWHTDRAGTLLITWDKANPFPDLKCEGSVCLSGKIGKDVAYGPYSYHIKIVTAEKTASIDPTIMIDP